ncbi:Kinesin-like protein KIN-7G [Linum perenne]
MRELREREGEMGAAEDDESMYEPKDGEEKILVSVRVRPLNEKEAGRHDISDWECINDTTVIYRNNISVSDRSMYPSAYSFDKVFGPDCPTNQVYNDGAKSVALSVVSGINSSVFAYGQTSSGKTYTMQGITHYTVADIYEYVERHKEREFILKFSAMEIYNESVRDLLSTDTTPLRLLDDPERGTVVERLIEETLRDWNHFQELMSICEAQRQIGETSLNETSSRSHQILRLTIDSSAVEFLGKDKSSTLSATVNFIDLAGSERASQAMSAGMRLKEGCHINRSLLTLGTVIRKLSKGRNGHIPFRDSKLTRILQSSLGGNARTAIICTMSPARTHVEQSRNTLLFASCAKEVSTNARVNVVMTDKALVKQLQRELARLENELRSTGSKPVASNVTELLRIKDQEIEKLTKEVADLTRQLNRVESHVEDPQPERVRIPFPWEDAGQQYPKLRVQNSWKSETSISYSPISEDPRMAVRSFAPSQSSEDQCSILSDETFNQLAEFQEFLQSYSSPEVSFNTDKLTRGEAHEKENEKHGHESLLPIPCKERDRVSISSSVSSNVIESASSPTTYSSSVVSSPPHPDTAISSLLEQLDDEAHKTKEIVLSPVKEEEEPPLVEKTLDLSPLIEYKEAELHEESASTPSKEENEELVSSSPKDETEAEEKEKPVPSDEETEDKKSLISSPLKDEKETEDKEELVSSPLKEENEAATTEEAKEITEAVSASIPEEEKEAETTKEIKEIKESVSTSIPEEEKEAEMTKETKEIKEADSVSNPQKEVNDETPSPRDFIIPSPEKSPWLMDEDVYSPRRLRLIRSKSCKALLSNKSAHWYERSEKHDGTPTCIFDKCFTQRRASVAGPIFPLRCDLQNGRLSMTDSQDSETTPTAADDLEHGGETPSDWRICRARNNAAATADTTPEALVEDTKSSLVPIPEKRDVGLDPIQDDGGTSPSWPAEFKRLQGEIIQLWHTCNISLVHRTYFFLLFKGDPADSFYMEVELRRLSFLKDTYSKGNQTVVHSEAMTASYSKRALEEEKHMLCKQMQRKLTKEERENLFLRWGIKLNTQNRRLHLVHRLWTKSSDMDHISESANVVAKLVGFDEGKELAMKGMFGLLNFTPKLNRRRTSLWKRSVLSIL